jgi:hypothetical protein
MTVDDREHAAYAHMMRNRTRNAGDAEKIADLQRAVDYYSALVKDGHVQFRESLGIARLALVRARKLTPQLAESNLAELRKAEEALLNSKETNDDQAAHDHLVRLLMRKSQELLLIDRDAEALSSAVEAVELSEEALMQLGRIDLHYEYACATGWLGRLLLHFHSRPSDAAQVLTTCVRVWEHLMTARTEDLLRFLVQARADLTLALCRTAGQQSAAQEQLTRCEQETAMCIDRGWASVVRNVSQVLSEARSVLSRGGPPPDLLLSSRSQKAEP